MWASCLIHLWNDNRHIVGVYFRDFSYGICTQWHFSTQTAHLCPCWMYSPFWMRDLYICIADQTKSGACDQEQWIQWVAGTCEEVGSWANQVISLRSMNSKKLTQCEPSIVGAKFNVPEKLEESRHHVGKRYKETERMSNQLIYTHVHIEMEICGCQ